MKKSPIFVGLMLMTATAVQAVDTVIGARAQAADDAVEIAYQIGIRKAQVDRLNAEIQQLSQQLQEKLKVVKAEDSATTATTPTTGTLHVE